ncbi:unnamed protein product [Rodentolepis nana]|uniref:Uncharacterized protein n=1 Tax=Rodentolepis nana TaxID=102285 RepID=A0A0R3U0R6_RODNA|nr:unnamed protein product [Rodentolepis nana]
MRGGGQNEVTANGEREERKHKNELLKNSSWKGASSISSSSKQRQLSWPGAIQLIKINELFTDTEKMKDELSVFNEDVKNISDNYNDTIPELTRLNTEFKDIHTEVNRTQPGLAGLNLIDFGFDQVKVKPIVASAYIYQFVDRFVHFAQEMEPIKQELDSMPNNITDKIKDELNLTEFYTQIETQITSQVEDIKPQISNAADTIPQYIGKAQPYISPALYALAGIMILIAIAFFVCLMLFIVEACRFRLFSCNGEGPSELASIEKLRRRSRACGGCRFCMCSFLLIFVIIFAILAAVILVISSFLAAELCPYVWQAKGVNQSDYVLNSFVDQNWPPISNDLLDMPAPNNVLFAIGNTCKPTPSTDPKLLPSIGVNKITNLTKLSDDPNIVDKFEEMSKEMADQISTSIKDQIITSIQELRQMIAFLEQTLQAVEADKAVVELEKFTKVTIKELRELRSHVNDTAQANKLTTAIDELENLMPKVEKVQGGYKGVDAKRQLPADFEKYLDKVEGILTDMKDKSTMEGIMEKDVSPEIRKLLIKLLKQGDASVNSIPEEVLNCASIHYIATSLIATGCSNSGLNSRFFGWALALILTVLFSFLSFVGLFNLWCFQSHQIRRFYGS